MRPRLLQTLNQCLLSGIQVILVSAPAGFGKSTLLAQWFHQVPAEFRVGWLSLDDTDSNLIRFFSYLMASLQPVIPGISTKFGALAELSSEITLEQCVAYFCDQVSDCEEQIILVLDDYQVITNPEVHLALKNLIDHLPENLHLVIAGRVEPPLPLARLRASGKLKEVRTADLRFNQAETNQFFTVSTLIREIVFHESLVDTLNNTTEGWAAGLQLVAIALQAELARQAADPETILNRFVSELSGSHRYILDYLMEEVLSRETPEIRAFLQSTCLLERFTAGLCAAVLSDVSVPAAQEILEYLERANLFVVPLDGTRQWFRYHQLFADMLHKQLMHDHPDQVPVLHHRAALWYEGQGMLDEALAHALQSGDPDFPAAMLEKHTLLAILQGRIASAQRWMNALPVETLLSHPRLCLDRAWALTFSSQTEAAIPFLERAEIMFADQSSAALAVKSEALGLRSFGETMYGNADEAIRLAQLALDNSPQDLPFLRCCNSLFLAGALSHAGRLDEALQVYRAVQPLCRKDDQLAGLALLEADFIHYVGMYLNARGSGQQAKDLLRKSIHSFELEAGGKYRAAALYLYVGLGKILFIENNLTESEQILEKGLQLDPASMSVAAFDGWLALWWVKTGQADYPAARYILKHLEEITHGRDKKVTRTVILTGALQDLLEGQVQQATVCMERLGLTGDTGELLKKVSDSELMSWRSNEFLSYARLLAEQHKLADCLLIVDRMEGAAKAFQMNWILYRVWMVRAIALYQNGDLNGALEITGRLLEQTSTMEANPARIFLIAGDPARFLLKEALRNGLHPQRVLRILEEFPAEPPKGHSPTLPEALTERELEVLGLMAAGLKNQQIADRLVISLNTIRYHTTNIFGKLSVSNRTAAIACARQLGIL